MSRKAFRGIRAAVLLASVASLASTSSAISRHRHKAAKTAPKSERSEKATENSNSAGRPSQLGIFGDWGVYFAKGEKSKTCYALATPKEREPEGLNRDPAYIFVSNGPGENIRQEVSFIMGFPLKEGAAHAEVAGSKFALIAKGANAWIENPKDEAHFVEALKKGSKLVVKAASARGKVTTDSYSLAGLSQALEKIDKECP